MENAVKCIYKKESTPLGKEFDHIPTLDWMTVSVRCIFQQNLDFTLFIFVHTCKRP